MSRSIPLPFGLRAAACAALSLTLGAIACSKTPKKDPLAELLGPTPPPSPGPVQALSLAADTDGAVLVGTEPRMAGFGKSMIQARGRGVQRIGKNRTMTALSDGLGTDPVYAVAVTAKGVYLAASGGAILRSTDTGKTWKPGDETSKLHANELLVLPDGRVFAATRRDGVRASGDDGQHWGDAGMDKGAVYALARHPNGHLFAGTSNGVWELENDAGTFRPAGLLGAIVKALAVDPSGVVYAGSAGTDSAALASMTPEKAAAAISVSSGVFACDLEASAAKPGAPRKGAPPPTIATAFGALRERATASSTAEPWKPVGLTQQTIWALLPLPDGSLLAGTRAQGLMRRSPSSSAFEQVTGIAPGAMVTSLLQTGTALHAGTGAGVFLSTDSGKTWAIETPDL